MRYELKIVHVSNQKGIERNDTVNLLNNNAIDIPINILTNRKLICKLWSKRNKFKIWDVFSHKRIKWNDKADLLDNNTKEILINLLTNHE